MCDSSMDYKKYRYAATFLYISTHDITEVKDYLIRLSRQNDKSNFILVTEVIRKHFPRYQNLLEIISTFS